MYAYNVNSAKCDGQAMLEIKIGSLSGPWCELEREEGRRHRGVGVVTLQGAMGETAERGSRGLSAWAGLVWSGSPRNCSLGHTNFSTIIFTKCFSIFQRLRS